MQTTGAVAACMAMEEKSGLPPSTEAEIASIEAVDWLRVGLELTDRGVGSDADAGVLAAAVTDDLDDAEDLEFAFELVGEAW